MKPTLAPEQVARVVVYATLNGTTQAAEKFGMSARTVQRYRLKDDPAVTGIVAKMLESSGNDWAKDMIDAARRVILDGASKHLAADRELNHKELYAWGGIMKLAHDAQVTRELLKDRLNKSVGRAKPLPPTGNVVALKATGSDG